MSQWLHIDEGHWQAITTEADRQWWAGIEPYLVPSAAQSVRRMYLRYVRVRMLLGMRWEDLEMFFCQLLTDGMTAHLPTVEKIEKEIETSYESHAKSLRKKQE